MVVAKTVPDKQTINRALNWLDGALCKIIDSGKNAGFIVGSDEEIIEIMFILEGGKPDERTIPQNAKIHPMFADIKKTGVIKMPGRRIVMDYYEEEVVKCFCVKWFAEEMALNGNPLQKPPKTVIDPINGDLVTIRPSTKDFGKKVMSDFVEWLYAFGADAGVTWSEKALECYQEYRQAQ